MGRNSTAEGSEREVNVMFACEQTKSKYVLLGLVNYIQAVGKHRLFLWNITTSLAFDQWLTLRFSDTEPNNHLRLQHLLRYTDKIRCSIKSVKISLETRDFQLI